MSVIICENTNMPKLKPTCVWSLVSPLIHKICPDLDPDSEVSCLDGLCSNLCPSASTEKVGTGDAASGGGSFPTLYAKRCCLKSWFVD